MRFAPFLRLALFLAMVLHVGVAAAQDYDAAGRHYAAGQERYAGKRFHTAALHFQAAYDITKDPVLLFNVGDAWQKAGDAQRALTAYRMYLKEKPTAADRADVEHRIAVLEAKGGDVKKPTDESVPGDKEEADALLAAGTPPPLAEPTPPAPVAPSGPPAPPAPPAAPEAAPPPPPGGEAPPPGTVAPAKTEAPPQQIGILEERPSTKLRIAAWCSVAATIALLTTGGILGLAAQSRGDEVERRLTFIDNSGQPRLFDAGARDDLNSLHDEGKLYQGLAIGFFTAAGAMAVTSTVLFIVDWKRNRERPHALNVAPSIGPGSAGLVIGGSF